MHVKIGVPIRVGVRIAGVWRRGIWNMRKSLWILLAVLVVAIGAPVARANSVIFDVHGIAPDGSIITGTITINTTLGDITAVDVIFGAPASTIETIVSDQGQGFKIAGQYGGDIFNASGTIAMPFSLVDGGTLVGYAGGTGVGNLDGVVTGLFDIGTTFTLTPTPEPGTLALMLAGFVGLMLGTRKCQG